MAKITYDKYFAMFAKRLEAEIDKREDGTDQEFQVNGLIELERRFRRAVIRLSAGRQVYEKFVKRIMEINKNILSARPYFRERQQVFSQKITPAIKNKKADKLYEFDINFMFIKFVIDSWEGDVPSKVNNLFEKVKKARDTLIVNNLPLAINRATLFFKKTPKSHLEYMDLVQIAADGLIVAVDKYCGPYTKVFRSVGIGRMVGNMIESYSETTIHFYPSDRRLLYKANSLSNKNNLSSDKASSTLSSTVETEIGTVVDMCDMLPDESYDLEEIIERKDSMDRMSEEIRELNMVEKKILKLRGVSI